MLESKEDLKSLLMNVKEESEKAGLKLNTQKLRSWHLAPSLYSFTLIKRLLYSSFFSATRVVSFAYLRLLIFLPAIMIPASDSSSPEFCMMYSAYKLNKQGDNILEVLPS